MDRFKINPNNKIYILSGSSGVGKDTILKTFLSKHPEFKLSVSHTTRPIRPGEVNGVDYYFVKDEDFYHGMENGEFLEWAIFSGNYYGTKKDSLKYMLEKTDNVILKLDTKGALKVKKLIPEAVLIFVAPPSLEELEARLRGRNTESEEAIQKRLSAIKTEMKNAEKFDYKIVNDTIDNAVESLENILVPKD
ncbi:guanylate kinase [bacterium]|nr:guanylate kinase [bacterium]